MESLFRPGKWFVLFCGLFILIWGIKQYLSDCVVKGYADEFANRVFNWRWQGSDWASQAKIVETRVLNHSDTDATVEVKGQQELKENHSTQLATADCRAILKLYKRSTGRGVIWELGEVQFPED